MIVPYADPRESAYRKNAFDLGEYGVGMMANSLALGCDCLGTIHYFDGHLADSQGRVVTIKNAICVHEEDYGMLWKHTDWRTASPRFAVRAGWPFRWSPPWAITSTDSTGTSIRTARSRWR